MNDTDLEQIRAILANALAPMQADLTVVKTDLTAVKADLTAVKTDVAANGTALMTLRGDVDAIKAKVDSWPDLHFLRAAAQRQQTDILSLRDEVRVQGAMLLRLDAGISRLDTSHTLLLEEIRATHTQITRMNDRVRKLEDAQAPPL
jgi:chromosome segregation ATPase